jgi:hypothetical protein
MITGTHLLLYSENPEADRVFFRDVLGHTLEAGIADHAWTLTELVGLLDAEMPKAA